MDSVHLHLFGMWVGVMLVVATAPGELLIKMLIWLGICAVFTSLVIWRSMWLKKHRGDKL